MKKKKVKLLKKVVVGRIARRTYVGDDAMK
jgi:hypothetical protein